MHTIMRAYSKWTEGTNMKKTACTLLCLALALWIGTASACTSIIVGREASADGSLLVGRNEDIYTAYNKNFFVNPATEGEGTVTLTDPINGFTIELPATGQQWTMISDAPEHGDGLYPEVCINEHEVTIISSLAQTVNENVALFDPLVENGLRQAYLPCVVIPYVTTAKEAVETLGAVVTEYGAGEAQAVLIADSGEAWFMEIVSGHQWAAVKVPDDCYVVTANQMSIGYIDLADTENVIASEGIYALPEQAGVLQEYEGKPHVAKTYGIMDPGSEVRVWGGQSLFSASQNVSDEKEIYDLFMKPDEKISLTDAMAMLSYRYEGTAHDANADPTVRAIGGESTCESAIFQFKPNGALVQWTAMANPEHSVFLPVYGALNETPEIYHVTGAEYNEASAYWVFRGLCTLAEIDRDYCGAGVKAVWRQYQQSLIDMIDAKDAEYLALDAEGKAALANQVFAETTAEAVSMATQMKNELMYYLAANRSLSRTPKEPFAPSLLQAE